MSGRQKQEEVFTSNFDVQKYNKAVKPEPKKLEPPRRKTNQTTRNSSERVQPNSSLNTQINKQRTRKALEDAFRKQRNKK